MKTQLYTILCGGLLCSAAMAASLGEQVQVFKPENLGEPSFLPCYSPRVTRPRLPPKEESEEQIERKFSGWTIVDTAVGASNEGVPQEYTRWLQTSLDIHLLDHEPLRGDPADIQKIYDVFARAAHKKIVRMAVWGDSHTTSDNLPGQIRRELQAHYGDAGTGFLMPFGGYAWSSVGRANACEGNPWQLGVVGIKTIVGAGPSGALATAKDAQDKVWVQVDEEARPKAKMSVSLLYHRQAEGGTLSLQVDQAQVIQVSTKGEASAAVAQLEMPVGPHRVQFAPVGDGAVQVAGMVIERQSIQGGGVIVDGIGSPMRGYKVWQNWDVETMKQWVSWRPYDLFMMSAGSVEALDINATEADVTTIVSAGLSTFRQFAPDAACLLMGPADKGKMLDNSRFVIWENHALVNKVIREVGPKFHCATWDLQTAMGGFGSSIAWMNAGLMTADLLHFTPAGYQVIGSRLVALMDP